MNDHEPGERKWNSDEQAIKGFTCAQLASLATVFIGTYRMMACDHDNDATSMTRKAVIMLQNHLAVTDSGVLDGVAEATDPEEAHRLGLLALSMALLAAAGKTDPRVFGALAVNLMEGVTDLGAKTGPLAEDDFIVVDVRTKPSDEPWVQDGISDLEIGIRIQSTLAPDGSTKQTKIGKMISDVVSRRLNHQGEAKK